MRRFKPVIWLLMLIAVFLSLRYYMTSDAKEECITRAQAARMLAYALYDMSDTDAGKMNNYSLILIDVQEDLWYTDEIHRVLEHNLMNTDGDLFHPTDVLTYREAKYISDQLNMEFHVPLLKKNSPIPLSKWLSFYNRLIVDKAVSIHMIFIDATPSTSMELLPWQADTSEGVLVCEGLAMDRYLNKRVQGYICDNQLLMAVPFSSNRITDIIVDTEENPSSETEQSAEESMIRVCLMTTDYTSEYHESVTISADTKWDIIHSNEISHCFAEDTVTFTPDQLTEDEIIRINAADGGRITVQSITRSDGTPSYEGTIEITKRDGSLLMINELPLEHYLYGVVPGEMPAGYHPEALKAQAVCARSYAMLAVLHPKYEFADLNDSTGDQVYMNQGLDERCTAAVNETYHQALLHGGNIVSAKYFSSSCGVLSDEDDIWISKESGDSSDTHLQAMLETVSPAVPALNDETNFRSFIDSPESGSYIEEKEPWFRWHTTVSLDTISYNLEQKLGHRMSVNPQLFTVLSDNGEIDPYDIQSVEVTERAISGVVRKIRIAGENQELTVMGEYNIRCLLAPGADTDIVLKDDSVVDGFSLLPSGYFYLAEDGEGYTVYGGGFGHGVGMSQNGANILAERGYDYKDILAYYFKDIEVSN